MKTPNDIGFIWEQTHRLNSMKPAIALFVSYGKKLRPVQMKEGGFFWSDVDGPIDAPRLIPGGSVCGFKTDKETFTKNGVAGTNSRARPTVGLFYF